MPRARNLKPGFFSNESLAECSPWARLCFAGLWTLADRDGRLEDRPKRIKGELFRFDSVEVEPLLQELERHGFILRYEVEGEKLIQVLAFVKHQTPHYSEKKSVIKPPPLQEIREHIDKPDSKITPGVDAASRGGRNPLNPDSRILTADPGEKPAARKRAAPPDRPEDVAQQVWDDWLALRKGKRADVTATVLGEARQEAGKAGMTLEAFLRVWCLRGTQGLQADWLKPNERPATQPATAATAAEPAWRREQRARTEAFAGPAAAKRTDDTEHLEALHAAPRLG